MNVNVLGLPVAGQENVSTLNNLLSNYQNSSNLNFNEIISAIFAQQGNVSPDQLVKAAAQLESDPAVKAAVYKAMAILNITGKTEATALSNVNELPKDIALNQLISTENFTPEQKNLFFSSVKIAAVTATFTNALKAATPETTASPLNPVTQTQFNVAATDVSKPQPAVAQPVTGSTQLPEFISSAVTTQGVATTQPAKQPEVIVTNVAKPQEPAVKTLELTVQRLKETVTSLLDTALGTSGDKITMKAVVDEAKRLIAELDKTMQRLSSYVTVGNDAEVDEEKVKETLQEIANKLQNVVMTAEKVMTLAQLPVNAVDSVETSAIETLKTMVMSFNTNSGADKQAAGNMAADTREIKDLSAKIIAMLNALNGRMEISKQTEYVFAPFTAELKTAQENDADMALGLKKQVFVDASGSTVEIKERMAFTRVVNASETTSAANVKPQNDEIILPAPVTTDTEAAIDLKLATDKVVLSAAKQGSADAAQAKYEFAQKMKQDIIKEVNWLAQNVPAKGDVKSEKADTRELFNNISTYAENSKKEMVLRQVADGIEKNVVATAKTVVKIALKPENLGVVVVTAEYKDKVLTGTIQVAREDVREILKANMGTLKESMANIGIDISGFDISMMNQYVGSGLNGQAGDTYKEWQGSVVSSNASAVNEAINAGDFRSGVDGYLNYLA